MGNFFKQLSDRAFVVASDDTWMEGAALEQLLSTSRLDGMRRVVGMPDLHPGRGYPVGAAFFSVGKIHPALVGNDIGCGMALWQTDLAARALNLDRLDRRLGNIDGPMDDTVARDEAASRYGVDVESAAQAYPALGTIGGGNHFAEFLRVDEAMNIGALKELGLDVERLLLLVHSGSRGLGEWILRQHVERFGHASLDDQSDETLAYLRRHDAALRYASCNRFLIAARLTQAVGAKAAPILDVHHNLVLPHAVDGESGWLHRKGANPADVGTVIIPGSRGDFSYLVRPVQGACESLSSLPHGAGRKWSRAHTKDRLFTRFSPEQLARTPLGSRVICRDRQLIYEEAPQAYKSIDGVVSPLVSLGLVEVLARLCPVLTYKTRGECC